MSRLRNIESDIDALRTAVAELRAAGAEILSARVVCDGPPEIHLYRAPTLFNSSSPIYVKSESGDCTHRAMQYRGCELVWITPIPTPGQPPRQFLPLNNIRTPHHG